MSHRFHPTVLREYDIRGVVGETLSQADAAALGRAFGTRIREAGGRKAAVGRDGRLTSPELAQALIGGLNAAGVDVVDLGIVSTPMLYYAVFELPADGGIMVTGSHNPPSHNGFKMMLGKKAFFGADIQELGRLSESGRFAQGEGAVERRKIHNDYGDRVMRDYEAPEDRDLVIVWDSGNGAAGPPTNEICMRLRARHFLLNVEVDGTFPNHHPDPTVAENLEQLINEVRVRKADLGIGFDGDGDRIGVVDEKGGIVWGDQLIAILAEDVLARHPGATIIADVKASQVLFDRIAELGGKPVMWKSGHSLIKAKMAELGAPLAGEMSGHIFFADGWYGFDDALFAAVRLIQMLANRREPLSALRDRLPQMVNTPELRFDCPDERKFAVVEEIRARLAAEPGRRVNTIDGVRVQTEDGWWLLRASNTQAALTARLEAKTAKGLERLKADLGGLLQASGLDLPEKATAGH
ncbi:MAG: phosphomannomutase/phosphoglucomutase [Proteobacteria bacterium]|nr:phosphomannomutase/phosphoglucomutase [Pseudomonadota bacterium]MBI3498016.1 phosphomannomutase/phosphoglucomutase [Pseudomonadota bacterium]